MRRLLRLALLLATLGAIAYALRKRPTPAAPPAPAARTGGTEPRVAEVGDLDAHGEPELDTLVDSSEHVSDTDVTTPPVAKAAAKRAPAKKLAAKKVAPVKKAVAKKAAPAKRAAKKAAPPTDPPLS